MKSLTDLVQFIPTDDQDSPEDIFAAASWFIFPDDVRNQHGEAGALLIYKNERFGNIELRTANPDTEDDRRLFGHYLWNAGILMAERLCGLRLQSEAEVAAWDVRGKKVLELGAGVGLSGMAASLAGASEVVISDYPSPVIIENIGANVRANSHHFISTLPSVQGHEWGMLNDDFAMSRKGGFDRILAADCFWMPHVHEELSQSMLHFLSSNSAARVYAIGGFHTGRAKLASFFDTAAANGLVPEEIYEEDTLGNRRPWMKERDGGRENITERKKWLVIAVLKRCATNGS